MATRTARVDALLDTIWAIAASPYVGGYTIGYTARSGHKRLQEHRRDEFAHLVILADKMTRVEASALEMRLQSLVRADKRHTHYRKYDYRRRDGAIYQSVGRADPTTAHLPIHSVYMAWWDR